MPDKVDKPESDPAKRDEVLKRMLKMKPKPHTQRRVEDEKQPAKRRPKST